MLKVPTNNLSDNTSGESAFNVNFKNGKYVAKNKNFMGNFGRGSGNGNDNVKDDRNPKNNFPKVTKIVKSVVIVTKSDTSKGIVAQQ